LKDFFVKNVSQTFEMSIFAQKLNTT